MTSRKILCPLACRPNPIWARTQLKKDAIMLLGMHATGITFSPFPVGLVDKDTFIFHHASNARSNFASWAMVYLWASTSTRIDRRRKQKQQH